MSWQEFWIIFVCCALTMLACRVLPLFLLKGKELPDGLNRALGFIPPAAFAALVANDLLAPGMFAEGLWPAAIPFAKGKELPDGLNRALGFIPPAAFAALVANDLLAPGMFAEGLWPAAIPFAAAICVVVVALKTKSLLWSALTGVAAFALLLLI